MNDLFINARLAHTHTWCLPKEYMKTSSITQSELTQKNNKNWFGAFFLFF